MQCVRCSEEIPDGTLICPRCGKNYAKYSAGSVALLILTIVSLIISFYWLRIPLHSQSLVVTINFYFYYILPPLAIIILVAQLIHTKLTKTKPQGDFMMVICFFICIGMVTIPIFAGYKQYYRKRTCLVNLKYLGMAINQYRQDNNDRNLLKENWSGALIAKDPDHRQFLICPDIPQKPVGYGYNASLSGLEDSKAHRVAEIVMLVDSDGKENKSGGIEIVNWRHLGPHGVEENANVLFYDGHVERASKLHQKPLAVWDPLSPVDK